LSIIRVRKDANYFAASNEPFNDKRLSWETRGLMGYLLSKPDRWEIRLTDLINQGPAREHKLRRMLAEARKFGYMNRIRIIKPNKTFDWITEIYESPAQNPRKNASSGFSTSGSSTSGKPRDIVSTESAITDLSISDQEMLTLFVDWCGTFLSVAEGERWVILSRKTGPVRAKSLLKWAHRKEIHMLNRSSLLDSLETAAENWRENGPGTIRPKAFASIDQFLKEHGES
jgi:hypothetical protein